MSIHDEADTRAERIDPVLAVAGWGHNYPPGPHLVVFWSGCDQLRQSLLHKAFGLFRDLCG
jgi:hypothetical protein